jgi:uncharacterized protein YcaQ
MGSSRSAAYSAIPLSGVMPIPPAMRTAGEASSSRKCPYAPSISASSPGRSLANADFHGESEILAPNSRYGLVGEQASDIGYSRGPSGVATSSPQNWTGGSCPREDLAKLARGPVTASLEAVRRLAVTKQHLAGARVARATSHSILSLVRDLAYIQWDPIRIVAPSHLISLWSRLEGFRPSDLDRLLWTQKKLFQHWTPIASIVLMEDFPLYHSLMRRYPESLSTSWGSQRTRAKQFLTHHAGLRKDLLDQLRSGPRQLSQFEHHSRSKKDDAEWTFGSEASQMLFHLLMGGEVMVVGHSGTQNLWGLSEEFLPAGVDRTELSAPDVDRAAARRAIRAQGTATPTEINYYFVRGRYANLRATLAGLHAEGEIHRLAVEGLGARDERYILDEDVPLLRSVEGREWQPRLSLLPPFDNLIGSPARTQRVFGFTYVREQFLPPEKRRFGTYVLPILWGDRLIGRIDPRLDLVRGELVVNAVHAEPGAPAGREVAAEIGETVRRFAGFLGVSQVTYSSRIPAGWRRFLR